MIIGCQRIGGTYGKATVTMDTGIIGHAHIRRIGTNDSRTIGSISLGMDSFGQVGCQGSKPVEHMEIIDIRSIGTDFSREAVLCDDGGCPKEGNTLALQDILDLYKRIIIVSVSIRRYRQSRTAVAGKMVCKVIGKQSGDPPCIHRKRDYQKGIFKMKEGIPVLYKGGIIQVKAVFHRLCHS